MSLINKMLQDLDKRHAADGGGKTLTQQLRPVQTPKKWRRIMWEVGVGLLIGAGWSVWVLYQISPRSVVTELVFQSQAKRQRSAGALPPPAAPMAPVPAQSVAPQSPPDAVMTAAAPSQPAARPAEAVNVDLFKLATEIATPFKEKSAVIPRHERKPAAAVVRAPRVAGKAKNATEVSPARAPEAATRGGASIDKHAHVQNQAERGESAFRAATSLLNQGRVAEAIDGYKLTLQHDPGHAAARQALVGLLLENRRIDEAQQFLQDGLRLNPGQSSYAMLLARIQVERGDLQGAHELLRKHAGSVAGDADYYAFDAAVLQRLGRHKEAVVGYEEALKIAPRAGLWWMGMGISLQADNRGAEALDAYRRAKSAGGLSQPLLAFVDQRMKQLQ